MPRKILDEAHIHPAIRRQVECHWRDIVDEVVGATERNTIVIVGMAHNPYCRKARQSLDAVSLDYVYLEYGNYFSKWRSRNALKMWTGWPTFPMVFIRGQLVGGATDMDALIANGELQGLVSKPDANQD